MSEKLRESVDYPALVKPMQERLGCLMYATTSTRPDIAYAVHQLCKVIHKPTPELIAETTTCFLTSHAPRPWVSPRHLLLA